MSESDGPPVIHRFDDFDKELIEMWQENTCPMPGAPSELARHLAGLVDKFDRRIFWRNFVEYGAGVVVLIRSGFDIAVGDRMFVAPLTSIAATIFIMTYIWRKHRHTKPLDPAADAAAYRSALLSRHDRQLRLARSVRYWYVLPAWIFFVVVLVTGFIRANAPQGNGSEFVFGLIAEFLLASGLCAIVIWMNEKYAVRKLVEHRRRIEALITDAGEV
jgi:hypothetical protein